MNSGIYKITTPDGSFYIGGSKNLKRRWREHRNDLKRGDHACKPLQAKTDDVSNLEFDVVEYCTEDALVEREQHYIDTLRPNLNQFPTVGSAKGYKYGPETLAKLSRAHSLENMSAETRQRRSEGAKRQWADPEKRERTRAAIKAKMNTPETRAKMAIVNENRPPISEETRERMRQAAKNRKRTPMTEETKAKISAAHMGKPKKRKTGQL